VVGGGSNASPDVQTSGCPKAKPTKGAKETDGQPKTTSPNRKAFVGAQGLAPLQQTLGAFELVYL